MNFYKLLNKKLLNQLKQSKNNIIIRYNSYSHNRRRIINKFKYSIIDNDNKNKYIINSILIVNVLIFVGWDLSDSNYKYRSQMLKYFTTSYDKIYKKHEYYTLITSCFHIKIFFI